MFRRGERRAEWSGPFWKQRSWQWSAGFFAVVLAMAGIVALTAGGDGTGDGGRAMSDGPPAAAATTKDGRPQGCSTDDSAGSALPTAVPKDVEWRMLGVTRVPVSASAGPLRARGTVWWCFAHTPTGAALAAHVIPSQMSGPDWRTVTRQQVTAGRGRDLFVSQRSTVQDVTTRNAGSVGSYAGFSVLSYGGGTATVELLIKSDQGYSATTIVLRWSDGDWKVVPDGYGALHTPVRGVQSTTAFVMWEV